MAKLIKVDGTEVEIEPQNGKHFTLKELYELVGSPIDIQRAPQRGLSGRRSNVCMVLNDNGRLNGLDINPEASKIWQEWYPIAEYPENNDGIIVGPVVMCSLTQIK